MGTRIWDTQDSPSTMLLRSDASGEDGWGVCISHFHIVGPWPEELASEHMLFKELVPVVIALSLISDKIPETVFGSAVDNTGAAFALNSLACRDKISLRLLQQLAQDLQNGGHTVLASHVRRFRNEHADLLSHSLFPAWWRDIIEHQKRRKKQSGRSFWRFPLVVQCLKSGDCLSGQFRMRSELFTSGAKT